MRVKGGWGRECVRKGGRTEGRGRGKKIKRKQKKKKAMGMILVAAVECKEDIECMECSVR
jgi:hypothetical protein